MIRVCFCGSVPMLAIWLRETCLQHSCTAVGLQLLTLVLYRGIIGTWRDRKTGGKKAGEEIQSCDPMRSREDNHVCLQNPSEMVPAILSKVHCPLGRAATLGHSQLPAGKAPGGSLHTAHTTCERSRTQSDKCNDVGCKWSGRKAFLFPPTSAQVLLFPSWFSPQKPSWEIGG